MATEAIKYDFACLEVANISPCQISEPGKEFLINFGLLEEYF